MRCSTVARYAIGCSMAAATMAGCNGGLPQRTTAPAQLVARTNSLGLVPNHDFLRRKSWIRPDAGKQWLIYASDADTGTVDIYNYRVKTGKLYGQITGFTFPYGQCVDPSGNVYIVDFSTALVWEFGHGGTTPIAVASDNYGAPIGCAVDPTTGNVAVANFTGSGGGGIDVFSGGLGGTQTSFTDSTLPYMWPPGYDSNGNLYVAGENASFTSPGLAELPHGGNSFTALSGLSIGYPASIQWDGSYLEVTDQKYQGGNTDALYRVTVSGSAVSLVRTTHLTDTCLSGTNYVSAIQPFIGGSNRRNNAVVAGNLYCQSVFDFWNYTNGGNPKRTLRSGIAPVASWGQSVSPPSVGS
jgi:hypothetical protein